VKSEAREFMPRRGVRFRGIDSGNDAAPVAA
jgi:hypothetical protein